jgi:hypothetical protein
MLKEERRKQNKQIATPGALNKMPCNTPRLVRLSLTQETLYTPFISLTFPSHALPGPGHLTETPPKASPTTAPSPHKAP